MPSACSSSTTSRTSSTSSRWPCATRASPSRRPRPEPRRSTAGRASSRPHAHRPRRHAPRHGGLRVAERLAAKRTPRADPLPHRPRRDRGQGPRPDDRRRRLRHQAVQPRGARRPDADDPAPHAASPSRLRAGCVFADLELDEDTREVTPRRPADRAHRDRVPAAALPDAQPAPRADPRAAARPRLGATTSAATPAFSRPTSATCARRSTPHGPPLIHTVRGVGYALRAPPGS